MLEKLQEIIGSLLGEEAGKIKIESNSILLDLGLSSLDFITLVCEVENFFNVTIPDRIIWKFKTVQDIIDYIEDHT